VSSASALAVPEIHEEWSARYRVDENEALFDAAFDRILDLFGAPAGATILDAGCGTGSHTARLARRGFSVQAIDFSDHALEHARRNLQGQGFDDRVAFRQADLLDLPFPDGEFEYAVCWGVLLHVPDVERAVTELARVIAPGGMLAISETNLRSAQTLALRAARTALRRSGDQIKSRPSGLEKWRTTSSGELVTRQTDVRWLIRTLEAEGLTLRSRTAGQLTDVYTRLGSATLRRAVHRLDELWFTHVRRAGPAVGNILVFERT
jgi:ubiquinone/menaquinone biosynthesis C-methylase UbiE